MLVQLEIWGCRRRWRGQQFRPLLDRWRRISVKLRSTQSFMNDSFADKLVFYATSCC